MKPAAAIFWAGNPSLMSFLALYFSYIWTESGAALVRYGQKKTRSKAGFFTVFVYSSGHKCNDDQSNHAK
tara:strand:- start:1312 stop:1521 length:210 start_codon:yes stop_codon:yes gene_type:complete